MRRLSKASAFRGHARAGGQENECPACHTDEAASRVPKSRNIALNSVSEGEPRCVLIKSLTPGSMAAPRSKALAATSKEVQARRCADCATAIPSSHRPLFAHPVTVSDGTTVFGT